MSLLWMIGLALAAPNVEAAAPVERRLLGVVRDVDGPIRDREGGLVGSGQLIREAGGLETGPDALAEVQLLPDARLRVFSETWVFFDQGLRLLSGRIWLENSAEARTVRMGATIVRLEPGSSAVLGNTLSTGPTVLCRAGRVWVRPSGGGEVSLPAGYSMTVRSPHPGAKLGGQGLGALLAEEVHLRLGSYPKLPAYILYRATHAPIRERGLGGRGSYWGDAVDGAETPAVQLLEQILRPPPFFKGEVPAAGPNVVVEVGFADD